MKIGFIGVGNMATAMIRGIIKSRTATAADICGSVRSAASRQRVQDELGITVTDNRAVAAAAGMIFLSVKPEMYEAVIAEIKDLVTADKLIVSIAPGKTLAWFTEQFHRPVKLVRTMPNTPALVGEAMTAVCVSDQVNGREREQVQRVLAGFGRVEFVAENLMEAAAAVSGSAPAYIYMVIEAMADAGVLLGLPRTQAYTLAAGAVRGSAEMVLETGQHPGKLKDMVCSPGGSTIEAVRVLEQRGLRSSLIEAMIACKIKSETL